MEDRMLRAMARWPNVPALYGWLLLDRRGNWHVRGERITRPQIIDTINAWKAFSAVSNPLASSIHSSVLSLTVLKSIFVAMVRPFRFENL